MLSKRPYLPDLSSRRTFSRSSRSSSSWASYLLALSDRLVRLRDAWTSLRDLCRGWCMRSTVRSVASEDSRSSMPYVPRRVSMLDSYSMDAECNDAGWIDREPPVATDDGNATRDPAGPIEDGTCDATRSCLSSRAGLIVEAGEVTLLFGTPSPDTSSRSSRPADGNPLADGPGCPSSDAAWCCETAVAYLSRPGRC